MHVLQGAMRAQKSNCSKSVLDGWRIGNGGPERGKNTLDLKSRITAEGDGYTSSVTEFLLH